MRASGRGNPRAQGARRGIPRPPGCLNVVRGAGGGQGCMAAWLDGKETSLHFAYPRDHITDSSPWNRVGQWSSEGGLARCLMTSRAMTGAKIGGSARPHPELSLDVASTPPLLRQAMGLTVGPPSHNRGHRTPRAECATGRRIKCGARD
uniref:Uncharacterized protein n=1 Tax=Oryza sativa subsp. japonica TaxID=39947 RepID=Q6ZB63_ORYSJ|nr:hypothetical protein [Oryza sativa Japonica Group]